jgi:thymidylate synthase
MNNLDKKYTDLLQDILDNGTRKMDRTGTGTISVFGRQIRHKMSDGFPLLTTKKMPFKTIVTELLWFLRGDTNIKFLVDNNCHIWDGDAYKNYEKSIIQSHKENGLEGFEYLNKESFIERIGTDDEFAKKWGELGPIYGKQWRDWKGFHEGQHDILKVVYGTEGREHYLVGIDQIANLINDLKTNPDSRRLMVNAWNVGELDKMTLPPCHYGFQVYTRELSLEERTELAKGKIVPLLGSKDDSYDEVGIPRRAISLMWNQRSVDTFLGLPFNIASYGLLLEIIAKEVNMVPDELIGNLGDTHLYLNHIERAKEQIGRALSLEERLELLKELNLVKEERFINAKFELILNIANEYNIPTRTREPFPLPLLKHLKTDEFYKSLSEDVSLLNHLENIDFVIENYQSHPTIKAPLSN